MRVSLASLALVLVVTACEASGGTGHDRGHGFDPGPMVIPSTVPKGTPTPHLEPFGITKVDPDRVVLHPGETKSVTITVERGTYEGPIRLRTGAWRGLVYTTSMIPAGAVQGSVEVAAAPDTPLAPNGLWAAVFGSAGGFQTGGELTVRVFPPDDVMWLGDVRLLATTNFAWGAAISEGVIAIASYVYGETILEKRRIEDGSRIDAFGSDGRAALPRSVTGSSSFFSIAMDRSGAATLAGRRGADMHFSACRIQPDGAVDLGFGDAGCVEQPAERGWPLDFGADGVMVLAHRESPGGIRLTRLLPDGTVDYAFAPPVISADTVTLVDDGVLTATADGLLRLGRNGQPMKSFGSNGSVSIEWPSSAGEMPSGDSAPGKLVGKIAHDSAGRILVPVSWVAASEDFNNSTTIAAIEPDGTSVRILASDDGTLTRVPIDPTFVPAADSGLWAIGRGYGGEGDYSWFTVARLTADGQPDVLHPPRQFSLSTWNRPFAAARYGDGLVVVFASNGGYEPDQTTWIAWIPAD